MLKLFDQSSELVETSNSEQTKHQILRDIEMNLSSMLLYTSKLVLALARASGTELARITCRFVPKWNRWGRCGVGH
jgi:hypothetical protein